MKPCESLKRSRARNEFLYKSEKARRKKDFADVVAVARLDNLGRVIWRFPRIVKVR